MSDLENSLRLMRTVDEDITEIKSEYLNSIIWLLNNTEYNRKTNLLVSNVYHNAEKLYNSIRELHEYKNNQYDELDEN